jgi:hypothetical protein
MVLEADDHAAVGANAAPARFDGQHRHRDARVLVELAGERRQKAAALVPGIGHLAIGAIGVRT